MSYMKSVDICKYLPLCIMCFYLQRIHWLKPKFKKWAFFKCLFIFESECEQGRGGERETQNSKQAPGSALSAQSQTQGSNSRTTRSWQELKSDISLSHPGAPRNSLFLYCIYESCHFLDDIRHNSIVFSVIISVIM